MRNISASLLAQATRFTSRPYIRAAVADTRYRWTSLHTGDGARYYVAQCALGAAIWRARVDSAGNVQTAAVTAPATKSQWTTWTTRATGALGSSDVAICSPAANTLRIFFIKSGYTVAFIESTDSGASWSSAANVVTALSASPSIAAAHQSLLYTDAATVKETHKPVGPGSWTAGASWSALSGVADFYGLAAAYLDDTHIYALAAADGRLYFGAYNPTAAAWTDPIQIAPGGHAAKAVGLTIRYPSITAWTENTAPRLAATWLENYDDGVSAWYNTIAARSNDAVHWGEDVTLYVWGDLELRTALCHVASTRIIYAANEKCVCTHKTYDPSDTTQNLTGLIPAEYYRETAAHRSTITLVITNLAEAYNPLGRAGTAPECIKPHSRVTVTRGYYTTGDTHEEEPTDPHYIAEATIRTTPDEQALILTCTNAWGLLERWRPTETLTYSGQTIRWLLAEFCAKVGLGYTDGSQDPLGRTLAAFTVRPETSAAEACRQLLRLAGAVCYWNEDGQMVALCLADYAPTAHLDITEDKILNGQFTSRANTLTSQSTFGNACASNLNLGQESMTIGMRIHQMYTDYRIASLEHAQDVQTHLWDAGRRSGRNETITVPLRPDAELWDTVDLSIDPTIVPSADSLRTITEIIETYHRKRNRYSTTLKLIAK